MMRLVICDDEPLAVDRLRDLVARVEGCEVIGVAGNGRAALDLVGELKPDALLLDIEMPALDGFDVVEALAHDHADPAPLIVFVTAYPQFAAHAFDTGAIDFLTKPVRLARLVRAAAPRAGGAQRQRPPRRARTAAGGAAGRAAG
jgi:DNA-binding LytR/AlgR family response regulator